MPTPDDQTDMTDDSKWITIVKDKKPNETWRAYAKRAAAHWSLSKEVADEYDAGVKRGRKPRDAALEALESFHCDDDNRESIKVFQTKGKWIERPRLIRLPNALVDFMEGYFAFTPYKRHGKNHTEIVIDDSEVLPLLMVCSTIADGKVPSKVKKVAKEGHRAARMLMLRSKRINSGGQEVVDSD
jgi:hypothetical protein